MVLRVMEATLGKFRLFICERHWNVLFVTRLSRHARCIATRFFDMAKNLKRLVYRSKSLVLSDDLAALRELFATSAKNNRRHEITGCLAQPDGHFVQVIEGEGGQVDRLMSRILADSRHKDVLIVDEWGIQARLFETWKMAQPDLTPLSEQAFRIINTGGSGAQVVGVLLSVVHDTDRLFV